MEEKNLKPVIEYAQEMVTYAEGNEQYHKGQREAYEDIKEMLEKHQELGDIKESIRKLDSVLTPIEAFEELIKRRDGFRNGWKPTWPVRDWNKTNYCIERYQDGLHVYHEEYFVHIFSFESDEQAREFIKENKALFDRLEEIL